MRLKTGLEQPVTPTWEMVIFGIAIAETQLFFCTDSLSNTVRNGTSTKLSLPDGTGIPFAGMYTF